MSEHGPEIRRRTRLAEPLDGLHPVVARVYAARGIRSHEELDPSLGNLPAPSLADIDAATERLERALRAGEKILVIGDFDADGATSVALALRALAAFGHEAVDYLVPNRFDYGYGLTPELVEPAAEFAPGLILTVDNGISSHAGVARAADYGIDTIVTDHHLPGDSLPAAVAVVNPNRDNCDFPVKSLAGVGVVFYLMVALRARLERSGWFAKRGGDAPSMAGFLDLVALGTVADVVPLERCNRILVEQGLRRIRAGRCCPGIGALIEAAKRSPERLQAGDLGFALAPRLNAAGRIADMAVGIQTLLADDADEARTRARQLDGLIRERRGIEAEMRTQADAELARLRTELEAGETLPAGLVLYDERWHQGVSGILAGRVREAVHRPTVIFADAGDGMLKGSARSVAGLHIRDVLAAIDAAQPHLIKRFGGHAMAAGLGLAMEHLDAFRDAFVREVERALGGGAPLREIRTDGDLAGDEMDLATAEALAAAGPWGAGFPEPNFDGDFRIVEGRVVGERHLKLRLQPLAGGPTLDAIHFNADPALLADPGETARVIYRLEVNEFRGRRNVQLNVEYLGRLDADAAADR
ncbi:MAG: single-stranded-DNA-specific exonuclease RecJ [Halofilum sp. (in: g-proteobacteria)]